MDIIQLIEEGQVRDPEACISAIEKASTLFESSSDHRAPMKDDDNSALRMPSPNVPFQVNSDQSMLVTPSSFMIFPVVPVRSSGSSSFVPFPAVVNPSATDTPSSFMSDPSSMSAASSSLACVPMEVEEVIPVGSDGLPDEDTISFLFDHVTHDHIANKAQEQPAYNKLAALREGVLARLNCKQL